MLISKTAKLRWSSRIKKIYVELGYTYTKMGDEFEVKVEHLTKGSSAIVQWECDGENCNEIITGRYDEYNRYVKEDGKIYCNKCATELFARPKMLKTKLKNGKSFEDLCIERNRQDLLDRWDYEKNGCLPSEVSYSTHTEYWFKCDKHPDTHHSELKNINNFANGEFGVMDCKQCNSVAQSVIDMYSEEYLWKIWNKELNGNLSPWDIDRCSNIEIWWNCQEDKHPPYLRDCNHSNRFKYKCHKCIIESVSGKNSPHYKHELTDEDRVERRLVNGYKQFVKEVMERDNYLCQVTGRTSKGDLVVHHLNGYNWDKENRLNPNNAITLCEDIHKLFHSIYGCGDNTKEQFEEFLMNIECGIIDISNIK